MNSQYAMVLYSKSFSSDLMSAERNENLIQKLKDSGFLGDFFSKSYFDENNHKVQKRGYLIGEHFLKIVTFLGCSPHLAIELPEKIADWKNFCYLEIRQHQSPYFFKGLNRPKASCPHCQSRLALSLSDMEQWQVGTMDTRCPKCQNSSLVENLKWRHSAGFGLLFIVIHSVYPSEAVPTEKLLGLLNIDTPDVWDYFYYEQ